MVSGRSGSGRGRGGGHGGRLRFQEEHRSKRNVELFPLWGFVLFGFGRGGKDEDSSGVGGDQSGRVKICSGRNAIRKRLLKERRSLSALFTDV